MGGANGNANSLNCDKKVYLLPEVASMTLFHYQYTCIVSVFYTLCLDQCLKAISSLVRKYTPVQSAKYITPFHTAFHSANTQFILILQLSVLIAIIYSVFMIFLYHSLVLGAQYIILWLC